MKVSFDGTDIAQTICNNITTLDEIEGHLTKERKEKKKEKYSLL